MVLIFLALDQEALMLVAVRGMHEAALLVSGITPEGVLDIPRIGRVLRGSPLSRSRSLMPTAMVTRSRGGPGHGTLR